MCKYIMWLIILPYVDHGIRYEWCKMKNMTVSLITTKTMFLRSIRDAQI